MKKTVKPNPKPAPKKAKQPKKPVVKWTKKPTPKPTLKATPKAMQKPASKPTPAPAPTPVHCHREEQSDVAISTPKKETKNRLPRQKPARNDEKTARLIETKRRIAESIRQNYEEIPQTKPETKPQPKPETKHQVKTQATPSKPASAKEPFKTKLLKIIMEHVGRVNAIPATDLMMQVFGRPWTNRNDDTRVLRTLVSALRCEGRRICSNASKDCPGYYIASTRGELNDFCVTIRKRALGSLYRASRIMKISMPDLVGQLALDLKAAETLGVNIV